MSDYRPIGFRLLPPAVKNLLIINGLMFLATTSLASSMKIDITEYFGLFYFKSEYFHPYQYITHLFMHGSFTHLFFNMFALWMFGNVIENIWGTRRFLIFYFVSGLGAAALHTLINWWSIYSIEQAFNLYNLHPSPDAFYSFVHHYFPGNSTSIKPFIQSWKTNPLDTEFAANASKFVSDGIIDKMSIPTVGASGAIFGLLLAFGMMFPNSLIYVYFAIPVKAKYFVIFYGAMELYGGVMNEPGDNVAHFAHLGGMLFGFLLIMFWKKKRIY